VKNSRVLFSFRFFEDSFFKNRVSAFFLLVFTIVVDNFRSNVIDISKNDLVPIIIVKTSNLTTNLFKSYNVFLTIIFNEIARILQDLFFLASILNNNKYYKKKRVEKLLTFIK
jgi:hypothetical protein